MRGELHFFGLPESAPTESYGSCIVLVPDTAFDAFATGMRAVHGKSPFSGVPRLTRPRRRRNTGSRAGFTVVDPYGNWLRIFPGGFRRLGGRRAGHGAAAVTEKAEALVHRAESAIRLEENPCRSA
ncbi:hypothetical protein [Streptomyces xiaopingdaonensis]|uniref:hypothetical protein n=1 Tax=Streptomyces xiaopingdaonensis TaxID=1565415 RepID=UPI001872DB2C|nr:hypothetical protein [Streptomyces xiaopingdaonensis]